MTNTAPAAVMENAGSNFFWEVPHLPAHPYGGVVSARDAQLISGAVFRYNFGMTDYDLAFSMGFGCGCSRALRAAGLQRASFPMDWVGSPGIVASAEMVASGFAGWLDRESLELVDVRRGNGTINRAYVNRRTGFIFGHDFHHDADVDVAFDEVAEKYARRIERLISSAFWWRMWSTRSASAFPTERSVALGASCRKLSLASISHFFTSITTTVALNRWRRLSSQVSLRSEPAYAALSSDSYRTPLIVSRSFAILCRTPSYRTGARTRSAVVSGRRLRQRRRGAMARAVH